MHEDLVVVIGVNEGQAGTTSPQLRTEQISTYGSAEAHGDHTTPRSPDRECRYYAQLLHLPATR